MALSLNRPAVVGRTQTPKLNLKVNLLTTLTVIFSLLGLIIPSANAISGSYGPVSGSASSYSSFLSLVAGEQLTAYTVLTSGDPAATSGAGGSGIVVVRYVNAPSVTHSSNVNSYTVESGSSRV
jgi:hypothetical protein